MQVSVTRVVTESDTVKIHSVDGRFYSIPKIQRRTNDCGKFPCEYATLIAWY